MSEAIELRRLELGEVCWAWFGEVPQRVRVMRRLPDSIMCYVLVLETGYNATVPREKCYGDDEILRMAMEIEYRVRDLMDVRLFAITSPMPAGTPAIPGEN